MSGSRLYYAGLQALGVPAATRRIRNAGVVLCYHNVVSEAIAGVEATGLHITQDRFRDQMRWMASHYTVVPLTDLLTRMRSGQSLRKTAAITFDDAYQGVFEYACPVLQEFRLPATVFVVTDVPATGEPFWWDHPEVAPHFAGPGWQHLLRDLRGDGRAILRELGNHDSLLPPVAQPATWEAIRAGIRAGIEVGVHSATHRSLPLLTDAELRAELVDSRATLARCGGVTAQLFAYPYGLWDERVRNATRAAGYAMALTLNLSLVSSSADPWAIPRVNIPARVTDAAFQAWVSGLSPHRGPRL